MIKKLLTVGICVLLVALAGCQLNQEPTTQDPGNFGVTDGTQPLTKVTVSEIRGISWASAYAAKQLGYFEKEGLDVEFVIYKDGPIAFQGMHAGDSDFCLLSAEPVLRAYDEGMESYLILTNSNNRIYAFATQPEIKSMQELKGKTVFAGMPGSAPYSFVLSLLKDAGMSKNDVNFINMEYGASVVAFGEGQVEGLFFDIYDKSRMLASVPDANILLDTTEPATHARIYGSEYCQTTIVTCTKKMVKENPETVQAFTNTSVRALAWMEKHTVEEWSKLLIPMFEGMTTEELSQKLETIQSSFSTTGEILPEGYATVEQFCYEQGLIQKHIAYEDIVASQFVENALSKQ